MGSEAFMKSVMSGSRSSIPGKSKLFNKLIGPSPSVQEEALSPIQKALQVPRGALKSVGGIGDLATMAAQGLGAELASESDSEAYNPEEVSAIKAHQPQTNFSEMTAAPIDVLAGRNLAPSESDTWGNVRQTTGELLNPLGGARKAATSALGALGSAAALHLTPKLTKEGTLGRVAEDIGKMLVGGNAAGLGKSFKYTANKAKGAYEALHPKISGEKGAIEAIKGIAGKENIPQVISDIEKHQTRLRPISTQPLTAEVVKNPGLSQIQSAFEGAPKHPELKEGISQRKSENLAIKQAAIEGMKTGEELTEEAAGESIRKSAEQELKNRKKVQAEKFGPEYEQLSAKEDRMFPKEATEKYKKSLEELPSKSPKRKRLEKATNLFEGDERHKIVIPGEGLSTLPPKISTIEKGISELVDLEKSAILSGKNSEARHYRGYINDIFKELEESHPEVRKLRQDYAKGMEEVNKINEDPLWKKIIDKTRHGKYKLTVSKVPSNTINHTLSNAESARNVKEILKDSPESWNTVKNGIADVTAANADTPNKFRQFWKKRSNSMKEILEPEQYEVMKEIYKESLQARKVMRHAATPNSATVAKGLITETLEKSPFKGTYLSAVMPTIIGSITAGGPGGMAGASAGYLFSKWKELKGNSFQKTIQNIILNPEDAKKLLQKYPEKTAILKTKGISKDQVIRDSLITSKAIRDNQSKDKGAK